MIFRDEAAVAHVANGLLDRSLPKAEWTHAAHFAAATWLLRYRPEQATPEAMATVIRSYNDMTETPNTDVGGYHATITMASLRAVAAHLRGFARDAPVDSIVNALLASPFGQSDWLLRFWTRECLFSVAARRGWVEPDIAPLPFL